MLTPLKFDMTCLICHEFTSAAWVIVPQLLRLHYGRHTPAVKKQISLARLSTLKYNPEKDDVIPKGKDQSALDGLIVSSSLAGIWAVCFYLTCRIDMN